MDLDHAKQILRTLADGRDPTTGAVYPPGSPYQQADTVRALYTVLEALDARPKKSTSRPIDPDRPKSGSAWTPDEEQRLRDAYAAHKPTREIAADHGRTPGAITARLQKLGLVDAPAATYSDSDRAPATPPAPPEPPADSVPEAAPEAKPAPEAAPRSQPSQTVYPTREVTQEDLDGLPF